MPDRQDFIKGLRPYEPWTPEGLALWTYAVLTAQRTGRVTFGQLWFRDPTVDEILHAIIPAAAKQQFAIVSPLFAALSCAGGGRCA